MNEFEVIDEILIKVNEISINEDDILEIKDNNKTEHFDYFIIDSLPARGIIGFPQETHRGIIDSFPKGLINKCMHNKCKHIITFYTKDNSIHSSALMSKKHIISLFKRYGISLPEHFN